MANELNLDLTPARTGYTMTVQLLLDGALYGSPIAATEPTPGYYTATMTAPAGDYAVRFIVDSTTIGTGFIRWDGAAEILDTPGTSTLLSRLSETRAGYLDAAISTRSTYDGSDTPGTVTLVSRLTSNRAGYLDKLNVTGTLANSDDAATYRADVSGLLTAAAYTPPPTTADVWSYAGRSLDGTQATQLANLDAAISSRLATLAYTEPLTIVETANAVTDALTGYPVATLAQVQAAGFTSGRDASLVATEAAAKAVADGRHKIDYLAATATQYDVDGNPRTVFDLLDQDGNPATTAQAAVERVPQP